MAQPDLIIIPFAEDAAPGYVDTIPDSLPPGSDPQYASWSQGFPPVTMTPLGAGGIPPRGQSFNGVLKAISQHLVFIGGGGQYKWDSEFAAENGYPLGALVQNTASTSFWLCTVDGNTTNPDAAGAGWVDFITAGLPFATYAEVLAGLSSSKIVSPATLSQRLSSSSPVIGSSRNAKISIAAASATATYTAEELFLQSSIGGSGFKLNTLSKQINLAATGAGGMDAGAAPVNGYVAIYMIYNPALTLSLTNPALLGFNATSVIAGEVYGGANMPAGYTASVLVGILPTNGSSQFKPGCMVDRKVWPDLAQVLTTTTPQGTLTLLSVAGGVPRNAKTFDANLTVSCAVAGVRIECSISGSPSPSPIGFTIDSRTNVSAGLAERFSMKNIPLITTQSTYYIVAPSSGALGGFNIDISSYTF